MRQKPKYLRYCLKCGKEMLIQEWRLKRGVGKFCSQSCSISYAHKGLPKPKFGIYYVLKKALSKLT